MWRWVPVQGLLRDSSFILLSAAFEANFRIAGRFGHEPQSLRLTTGVKADSRFRQRLEIVRSCQMLDGQETMRPAYRGVPYSRDASSAESRPLRKAANVGGRYSCGAIQVLVSARLPPPMLAMLPDILL